MNDAGDLTTDARLAALFAESSPPARDPGFVLEVMTRVARRRAWARVGSAVPWAVSGALVLWALQPTLAPSIQALSEALVLPGAVLGGVAVVTLTGLMAVRRLTP